MDYIFIKEHLDEDPKIQRYIHNRILYQTSDTTQYANFKRKMNQSYDQSIRQKAVKKDFRDISFILIQEKLSNPQQYNFPLPCYQTQRSPYFIKSKNGNQVGHQNRYSLAVKNIQRKQRSSATIRNDKLSVQQRKYSMEYNQNTKINSNICDQPITHLATQKYNELSILVQDKKALLLSQQGAKINQQSQAVKNIKQKIQFANATRCKTAEQAQKFYNTIQSDNQRKIQNQSFDITIQYLDKSCKSQKSSEPRPFSATEKSSNFGRITRTLQTNSNKSPIRDSKFLKTQNAESQEMQHSQTFDQI